MLDRDLSQPSGMHAEPFIRPMGLSDLDQVLAIEQGSFPTPWSRAAFQHELAGNDRALYLVCAEGDVVLGYAGMWVLLGECHITNLAVRPDYRARGLGRLLLQALVECSLDWGCKLLTLEVRESNEIARRLYTSAGFHEVGRRHGYYTDSREDALIMTRHNDRGQGGC